MFNPLKKLEDEFFWSKELEKSNLVSSGISESSKKNTVYHLFNAGIEKKMNGVSGRFVIGLD